ncbi:HAMP domain-containing sensor histidine kinase [Flavobacterium selenitireducens]|uniref:HAMP domain-containing sensor histidine kinase n=1 Tax=Flavobacterium selenitireducens TaxID=2722704 RepID=UPI00168ABBBB|nr:ATP-binding protein [Flavobacterium selenitireducens]MBD3581199.1 HAMP domain-containing protein [Flavobacterium selenitireducens]
MKTKTKLNLAVGLLLALILLLTILSAFYIFAIKRDTENILKANYNTLEYSRQMLSALDGLNSGNVGAIAIFEENLAKQLGNITEAGEENATMDVKRNFSGLLQNPDDLVAKANIRQGIFEVMKLNMDALKKKSELAKSTAETANWVIAIAGTLCFLIAFNLMVNLPHHIANPIRELTDSIRQIAKGNYKERVHFDSNGEFGDLANSFNVMAQKLEEFSESNLNKLLVEKKRIEALLDNMHDPVIGLDNGGTILSANEEALKVMGLTASDAIGKQASDVARKNDLLQSLIVSKPNGPAVIKIFADGKESYFERENVAISITPTGEKDAIAIGNFIILRNITAFKELDFAKTNFIATVSHELKTPIAAIKFSLKLLENPTTGSLNDDQRNLVESIADDSRRLLKITGELLEMSQLETGNIQLAMGKCAVSDIVTMAVEAVRTQAEQKRVSIATDNLEVPEIRADKDKTSWVLINFLTNAIRYSHENSGISIWAQREDQFVLLSVKDNGQGIDKNYQSRIFDRYFQVPGRSKSGTGLGLAISREFIEAQGGSIGVESNLGLGSRFWFKLPVG